MPDKIAKLLRTLGPKQRARLARLLERIIVGEVDGLDTKKLKGARDIYRVRMGDIRVIYRLQDGQPMIVAVERRSDTTYNDV